MKSINSKTSKMKSLEERFGFPIEELLRSLYVDKHMSLIEMETLLSVNRTVLITWLIKAGIYSRKLDI